MNTIRNLASPRKYLRFIRTGARIPHAHLHKTWKNGGNPPPKSHPIPAYRRFQYEIAERVYPRLSNDDHIASKAII